MSHTCRTNVSLHGWKLHIRSKFTAGAASAFCVAGAEHRASKSSCGARGRRWGRGCVLQYTAPPSRAAARVVAAVFWMAGTLRKARDRRFAWQVQYTEPLAELRRVSPPFTHRSQTTLSHPFFHTQHCHTPSLTQHCVTPSFTHNFVTHHLSHTTFTHYLSPPPPFVFPSFPVPATTFLAYYWKKLTCGVFRSFYCYQKKYIVLFPKYFFKIKSKGKNLLYKKVYTLSKFEYTSTQARCPANPTLLYTDTCHMLTSTHIFF